MLDKSPLLMIIHLMGKFIFFFTDTHTRLIIPKLKKNKYIARKMEETVFLLKSILKIS